MEPMKKSGITPGELAAFRASVKPGDVLIREADPDPRAKTTGTRSKRTILARVVDTGKPFIVIFEGGRSETWAQALIKNRKKGGRSLWIRLERKRGVSYANIAELYGLAESTVRRICEEA